MNKKIERTRRVKEKDREKRENEEETKLWEIACLITNSSVEVGYGFYAIRSKLLIANDMSWVVL